MPAMADGHQANHASLAINSVHNPKTADTIFPQAIKFAQEWLPTLRVGRNATNSRLDGTFRVRVERANHFRHNAEGYLDGRDSRSATFLHGGQRLTKHILKGEAFSADPIE